MCDRVCGGDHRTDRVKSPLNEVLECPGVPATEAQYYELGRL